LASARPRCEILFFSDLSISAYLRRMHCKPNVQVQAFRFSATHVLPSCSKMASQPMCSVNRRPSELISGMQWTYRRQQSLEAARFYPAGCQCCMCQVGWGTDPCAPLEENGLVAGAFGVGESADCISRLVIVSSEYVVQAIMTDGLHEPLAMHQRIISKVQFLQEPGQMAPYMYGPGRSPSALKQRHVSSTSTGPLTFSED
jgi:hypothetical protein